MKNTLHYIHDPFCGWCYAAEKMTDAIAACSPGQFDVQLHAGGLFSKMHLSEAKRAHIRAADARIGELTGQTFGAAYLDGLLAAPSTLYDSVKPIAGILAAERVQTGAAITMLKALQQAHYIHGAPIVEPATIANIAREIGLNDSAFSAALRDVSGSELQDHLRGTRQLMERVRAHGFPTFVAQRGCSYQVLPHEHFYGNPQGFATLVMNALASGKATNPQGSSQTPSKSDVGRCDGDSCGI